MGASQPLRAVAGAATGVLLALLLLGCGGGNQYSADEGQLFQRFLPTEREVSAHPDSLRALTIAEEDNQIRYKLDRPYQSLIEKWSVTCRFGCGRSYATLWSLELTLASLQANRGILFLHRDPATKMLDRVRRSYADTLRIDVYWFAGDGKAAGPRYRAELHVQDSTYLPVRREYGPLRRAFVRAGVHATYRRNRFYYRRVVDGRDILEGAPGIRLELYYVGLGKTRFVWRWAEEGIAGGSGDQG